MNTCCNQGGPVPKCWSERWGMQTASKPATSTHKAMRKSLPFIQRLPIPSSTSTETRAYLSTCTCLAERLPHITRHNQTILNISRVGKRTPMEYQEFNKNCFASAWGRLSQLGALCAELRTSTASPSYSQAALHTWHLQNQAFEKQH